MLRFAVPAQLDGLKLVEELRAGGYDAEPTDVMVEPDTDAGLLITARTASGNEVGEQSRGAIQNILDAHTGAMSETQKRPLLAGQKVDAALAAIRNELANWPADLAAPPAALAANANLATTVAQVNALLTYAGDMRQRMNQLMAQEQRNTQRLGKIAQLLRGTFDVPED